VTWIKPRRRAKQLPPDWRISVIQENQRLTIYLQHCICGQETIRRTSIPEADDVAPRRRYHYPSAGLRLYLRTYRREPF
jgi:hypothetical protein